MYVPSDQACSGSTGKTPPSPQSVARDRAGRALVQQYVNSGNAAMRGLTDRDWRDFQELGPQVAWQVVNAQQNGGAAYGTAPGSADSGNPVGVEVGGSNPATGANRKKSWVPSGRKNAGPGANIDNEKASFVQAFGGVLTPWKVYTGPLPNPGTPMSLVYGGSPSNRSVAFGPPPVPFVNAAAGYYRASCPTPVGVEAIPLGESDYAGASTSTTTESTVSNATMWAIAGILGLAAVSFLTEKHTERKSRKAAK